MHERLEKIINSSFGRKIDKYCNSIWYIIAIGVICVISHSFNIPVVGAAFLTVLLVFALIFCKNTFTIVPFLLMCSFVMSEETKPQSGYYNTPVRITFLCLMLVEILAALVVNLIYYGNWKKIFRKAYLSISLCIVTVALVIGGLGTPFYSLTGLGMSLAIGVCMFLPYSLLINCNNGETKSHIEYFCYTMLVVSCVIFFAVIKQYIMYDLNLEYHPKNLIVFGYAISNTAAAFVVIAIPTTYYLVYKYKNGYLYMIAVAMELITIALTFSAASLLVALIAVVAITIAMCFIKKEGKISYFITIGGIVLIAIIFLIVFSDKLLPMFKSIIDKLFDGSGSGRVELWKQGFDAWKKYPIFGLNLWYLPPINNWYYSFHCTLLTYLYCAGVVGLLAYLYHRYKTVSLVFSTKLTAERVFISLGVLVMLLNALIDIGMTMPQHLLYYSIMLALIECDVNETKKKNAQSFKNENVGGEDSIAVEQSKNVEKSDLSDSQNINNVVEVK